MRKEGQVPCVFRGVFIREQVDPRIKEAWPGRAPWGDLRKTWKSQYCLRVNPTGYPEDCPFTEEDCAMSFLQAVLLVTHADRPGALFRKIASSRGSERADQRPLARDRVPPRRPSHLGDDGVPIPVREVAPKTPGPDLSRPSARPTSIGALLGSLDLGARQVRTPDGEEGLG